MITEIALHNFKSHKNTTLYLDSSRLHAIVGQNSSGKTSILQALSYLGQLTTTPASEVFKNGHSPETLVHTSQESLDITVKGYWNKNPTENFEFSFFWEKRSETWYARYTWIQDNNSTKIERTLRMDMRLLQSISTKNESAPLWDMRLLDSIPEALGRWVYLKLVGANLAKAAYSDEVVPRVAYDGGGLAPALDFLRSENLESFNDLQKMLQKVIPSVKKVDVRRAKVEIIEQRTITVDGKPLPYDNHREVTGQEIVLSMINEERIPSHAVSEGTMLTLGLLAVLYSPEKPNLVLLDDIEQGLHPHAQRALMNVLKQIVAQMPSLQIIFSTHSPYIVDELKASQVHVLHRNSQGYVLAGRLDQHPDATWATQALTTGEFWDAEGEAWVEKEPSGG